MTGPSVIKHEEADLARVAAQTSYLVSYLGRPRRRYWSFHVGRWPL